MFPASQGVKTTLHYEAPTRLTCPFHKTMNGVIREKNNIFFGLTREKNLTFIDDSWYW